MLRYIGHPFVDVGVATITTFSKVETPEEITEQHLDAFVEWIIPIYLSRTMVNFVTGVLFTNFYPFNQAVASKAKFDDLRKQILIQFLGALYKHKMPFPNYETLKPKLSELDESAIKRASKGIEEALQSTDEGEPCAFSGDTAIARVSRELIPMTLGREAINFVPEGRPNLPIAGWCLLALFAMPFGGLSSRGRVWITHSNDASILQFCSGKNLERNRATFQRELSKLPNYRFAKSHLVKDLVETQASTMKTVPLTAYLFTSSNQSSDISIYHLPSNVISFIAAARNLHPAAWQAVVKRAEFTGPTEELKGEQINYTQCNFFYEDLFDLPQEAWAFLKRYLLRQPHKWKPKNKEARNDPRFEYSFAKDREAISWSLTELFLERIMNMDKVRIEAIKKLADRLANYIRQEDSRLFKRIFLARNDYQMRLELLKAGNAAKGTLLPYDEFIEVFFIDEGDTAVPDWYLARDLLLVRIIERLHEDQWIEHNPDLINEINEETTQE